MSNINDEMKANADNAIIQAKERFGQEIDFSEQSIVKLENLIGQIYQTFSNNTKDEETSNVISDTAIIWGSFLGEYMRLKWGGTWILEGSDQLVSVKDIDFSPISLVYQKLTSHPEYSVENYLIEAKRIIYTSVISPQKSQSLPENIGQPNKQISIKRSIIPVTIDKHLIIALASIGGILLLIVACVIGYMNIKTGRFPLFGLFSPTTASNTELPIENTKTIEFSDSTNTPFPTVTPLPIFTPNPTFTPHPSYTPFMTYTQIVTLTPTVTHRILVSKPTLGNRMSPTSVLNNPTFTPIPPTKLPPTATEPPPIVIESCEIDPFTVPIGINVTITYIVHFSSHTSGYGFEAKVDPIYPGQSGCIGIDNDGDGMAYCDGSSGMLPDSTTVYVTLTSSVGDCVASYSSR